MKFHDAMKQGPSKDCNVGLLGAGKGKILDQKMRLVNVWTRAAIAPETFKKQHPDKAPPPACLQANEQLAAHEATQEAASKKTREKKKEGQKLDDAAEETLGLQPSGAASFSAQLHHSVNLNVGAKPDAASLFLQKGNEEEPIDLNDDGAAKSERLSCRHLALRQQTAFL